MFRKLLLLSVLCILGAHSASDAADKSTTSEVSTDVPTTNKPTSHTAETTTKQEPETTTTTVAPETTTTTVAPETTTTKAPETTTPVPTTTPKPATSTVSPTPAVSNKTYEVEGVNNSVCIRLKAGIQLDIKSENITHNMNPETTEVLKEKSSCKESDDSQRMALKDGNYELTLIFAKDKTSAYVRNVTLEVSKDKFESEIPYFKTSLNNSYFCKVESIVKLDDNATVLFYELQLQAYMHNETEFAHAEECTADNPDDKMSNVVPIAVAIALLSLVVLILIGYLITRRRSQKKQYQSM